MSQQHMTSASGSTLAQWTDSSDARAKTLDPLFYWAERVKFRGFLQTGTSHIRVAIQLRSPADGTALVKAEKDSWLRIAPRYLADLRNAKSTRCFLTARVMVDKLGALASLPGVLRLKPGVISGQRRDRQPELWLGDMNHEALRPALVLGLQRSMSNGDTSTVKGLEQLRSIKPVKKPKALAKHNDAAQPRTPLIGVIDFGCAFAHPFLQRQTSGKLPSATRISWLWDQGRSAERPVSHRTWPWQRPKELAYGREASAADLDALIHSIQADAPKTSSKEWIEQACYLAAEMPELLDSWSHGTAVLGVAAAWPHTHSSTGEEPDPAGKADVVFVQLPKEAIDDQSGGWVTTYVLDGIEYILAKADGRDVVINISIGSYAGSHDGASLLETALAQYAKRGDVTLVLAAGNGAGRKGHAQAEIGPGGTAPLKWVLPTDDPTQSFLELWYERPKDGKLPQFSVEHPSANAIDCTQAMATPIVRAAAPDDAVGAWVHVPSGNGRTRSGMVLMALAPTLSSDKDVATTAISAPAGSWTITVHNPSNQHLKIHAYIERDEVGASHRFSRPDSILSTPKGSAWKLSDEGTLTAQGTATGVCTVGSYVLDRIQSATNVPPSLASGSGRGAARMGKRKDVDCLAPGSERIDGLERGLVVLPNFSGPFRQPGTATVAQAIRLQGTSLAAPWVARQKYNQLPQTRSFGLTGFPDVLRPGQVRKP